MKVITGDARGGGGEGAQKVKGGMFDGFWLGREVVDTKGSLLIFFLVEISSHEIVGGLTVSKWWLFFTTKLYSLPCVAVAHMIHLLKFI